MPKDGAAPTSPNAMPGGLGAILQQPGAAPKGASSRSIASIMDTARKMSDMQLADVLSGKSLDVPQYVAMTEAMGRKSLRTAMQGAQAQQQLNKPSVKDRLLAEEAQATQMAQAPQGGIDQLPAPNMAPEGMAGGGIVAFDEGGEVPRFNEGGNFFTRFRDSLYSPEEIRYENMKRGRPTDEPTDKLSENQLNAISRGKPLPAAEVPMPSSEMQKEIDDSKMRLFKQEMAAKEEAANVKAPAGGPTKEQIDALNARPRKSGIDALTEDAPKKTDDGYLSKLVGQGDKTRAGIASLKNEAQSQILLDAMSVLMGNRNLAEAGGKFGTLAAGRVGAMGKESRALEKEANEYDLNLARYQEAVKSGDQDRAMQLKKMLLENQYHMAMVNKPDSGIAMLNALQDPAKMKIYQEKYSSRKPTDQMSLTEATKQWNDITEKNRKRYKELQGMGINNEQDYYKFVNGSLLSATIPGQGANVIGTLK
jgi:hypothetical protein